MHCNWRSLLLLISGCFLFSVSEAASSNPVFVRWCAGGYEAYYNCLDLAEQMRRDASLPDGYLTIIAKAREGSITYKAKLVCVFAAHDFECADLIREGKADIVRMTAEELYGLTTNKVYSDLVVAAAGMTNQHSCTPPAHCHRFVREYSVAVVRRSSNVKRLDQTEHDRRICFGNVSSSSGHLSTAGWIIPVSHFTKIWNNRFSKKAKTSATTSDPKAVHKDHGNRTSEVNVHTPTMPGCPLDLNVVQDLFPASCAAGRWASDEVFGPFYSQRLCSLCIDRTGYGCSSERPGNDPLTCLKSQLSSDMAFVSSSLLEERQKLQPPMLSYQDFGLFCGDDSVAELDRYSFCHWGIIPEDAYVVSGTGKSYGSTPEMAVGFLRDFVRKLEMHAKAVYYHHRARRFIARDQVIELRLMRDDTSLVSPFDYIKNEGGKTFLDAMNSSATVSDDCRNKNLMRLCVVSQAELQKCHEMQLAFGSAAFPVGSLQCVLAYSDADCVQQLQNNQADIAVLKAHHADDYVRDGKVKPLMKETYAHGNRRPAAVAVSFIKPKVTGLMNILNKDTSRQLVGVCSSGTDSFAGWEAPNSVFKGLGMIPQDECLLTEQWADGLKPSCVPGALSASVTLGRSSNLPVNTTKAKRLCEGCGSSGDGTCKTQAEATDANHLMFDSYYGDIGALRCILRKRGDIAFVRSTALETLKLLKEANEPDFKLVDLTEIYLYCGDGLTTKMYSPDAVRDCNLGFIPDQWMVARANADLEQLSRWQDVWVLAQERARAHFDWLKTYIAFNETERDSHFLDLIFSNATVKLERFDLKSMTMQKLQSVVYTDTDHFVDPFPTECRTAGAATIGFSTIYSTYFAAVLGFLLVAVLQLN